MYNQKVDLHSICFGPFPDKASSFDLKITKLIKDEKKTKSSNFKVVNYDTEEKIMGMLNQDSLEGILEWKSLTTVDEETQKEEEQWFLTIKLFALENLPQIQGDFCFRFKSSGNKKCKFYFWLNVGAILYNNELKEITLKR